MLAAWAAPTAAEESRDEVANQQSQAQSTVDSLRSQLTDIDAELAQIYLDLADANAKIPVAEQALADAQQRLETANREHEIARGQLTAAQAEYDALDAEMEEAEAKQDEATKAIGDLARRMYKDGTSSAVVVALTKSGTQSIDQRTAAADAMARTQTQALNAALDVQATQRTRVRRQEAITTRIAELEDRARVALEEAEVARTDAEESVKSLEAAKADAEEKQQAWDARKAEAESQLATAQADLDAATARLAEIDAANRAANTTYVSSGGFVNPVPASSMIVTSPFGWRMHPVLGYQKFHSGVDFAAACGEPIYAAANGQVSSVSSSVSAGTYVDVNHGLIGGNSVVTEYLHMQAVYVSPGQYVTAGTVLGEVGMTGYATGCHLHFGVAQNGSYVDPMGYL